MLGSCTYFFFQKSYNQLQKCARHCMAINHQSFNLWRKKMCIVFNFLELFPPSGCLASWRGGQAAPQRTCATCLQRWTLSSPPWPSSTSSTKSCWDLSCTDERTAFLCSERNIHVCGFFFVVFFLHYHLFQSCVFLVFDHRAWLIP